MWHSLVFWKLVVKVDLVCADDVELLIDDGSSEVVDCELDAEEMSVGFGGIIAALGCDAWAALTGSSTHQRS